MTIAYQYEIALSYAGEDRPLAEVIATGLRRRRVSVFYDQFEQAQLWGKDLYQYLFDVYSSKAKYCVVFVSRHYAAKPWTRHELKAAQSRQLIENSEYILPVRLDDTPLPGLPDTIGYVSHLNADEIVGLIMEKLGRNRQHLFRGMDLGHDVDPLRSSLAKMEMSLFEDICKDVLACFKYQTAREESLASSVLSRNSQIGTGIVRVGVFFDSFAYAQQLFTEIGFGVDESVSRVLGQETYFSEGGTVHQLHGPAFVAIHSLVESVPTSEDLVSLGEALKGEGIANAIFFVNESVYETNYFGMVDHFLRQMGLNPVALFLEDIAYQVLTTEVYRKHEPRLQWAYKNHL